MVPMTEDLRTHPVMNSYAVKLGKGGPFVQDELAPIVSVANKTYEYPFFGSDLLMAGIVETKAPDDGPVNELTPTKPKLVAGRTTRHGLKESISGTDRRGWPNRKPFKTAKTVLERLVYHLRLDREKKVHDLLLANATASGFHNSPTVKWNATSGTIAIQKDWYGAVDTQEPKLGVECNTVVIPKPVARVMALDPVIQAMRKEMDSSQLIDGTLPKEIWGKRVLIPGAMENTANPGLGQNLDRIWKEDNVYFLYLDPKIENDDNVLTAASTHVWDEEEQPYKGYFWREADAMDSRQWVGTDIHYEVDLLCQQAIYVLDDVLS